MFNALTLGDMSPELLKVADESASRTLRRSRMVEITSSGSGEGPGWADGRGYSTGPGSSVPMRQLKVRWDCFPAPTTRIGKSPGRRRGEVGICFSGQGRPSQAIRFSLL